MQHWSYRSYEDSRKKDILYHEHYIYHFEMSLNIYTFYVPANPVAIARIARSVLAASRVF